MNSHLSLDFTVNKPEKTVYITVQFKAPLSLVWEAFTKQELLDQWTAPMPWTSKTKYMNFEVGGKRFYAMVSPEGLERLAIQKYTFINPTTTFKMSNAFADQDENPEMPGSEWEYKFQENNGLTEVNLSIYNESLERMEKMLEMGFKEGFTMTLKNLEKLLANITNK